MAQSAVLLSEKFDRIRRHLNESGVRLWAANEAVALGYGGVSLVSRATGISRTTIHTGIEELQKTSASLMEPCRVRRAGGGRKRLVDKAPSLKDALNALVDPVTRGDPESALRRTSKSTTKLAADGV